MLRNFMIFSPDKGQIALPFVILVGGIIVEIVIAGSIVAFFANASVLGERLSVRAITAAKSGTYDAMMKIANNKEFAAIPVNYNLTINGDAVSISVSRTIDDVSGIYNYIVESVAIARSRQRKIVAELIVDQITGDTDLRSLGEAPVQ